LGPPLANHIHMKQVLESFELPPAYRSVNIVPVEPDCHVHFWRSMTGQQAGLRHAANQTEYGPRLTLAMCAARNNSIAATVDDVPYEIRRMIIMTPEDAKATIEQVLQSTGRDGAIDLVAKMHAFGVLTHSAAARELYCSSNGDRWYLVRDAVRVSVVHVPNSSSGGQVENLDLRDFLARSDGGPEYQELLRLIGTLVEAT
jgi:hypothetical protein